MVGAIFFLAVLHGVTLAVGYATGWAEVGKGPTAPRRFWEMFWRPYHKYDFREGPWVWLKSPFDWFYALQIAFVGLALSGVAMYVFPFLLEWSVLGWLLSLFPAPSVTTPVNGWRIWESPIWFATLCVAAFLGLLAGTYCKVQKISTSREEVLEGIRLCLERIEERLEDIEAKRGWWQRVDLRAGLKFSVLVKEGLIDLSNLDSAVTPEEFVRAFRAQVLPQLEGLGRSSDLSQLLRDYDFARKVMIALEIMGR